MAADGWAAGPGDPKRSRTREPAGASCSGGSCSPGCRQLILTPRLMKTTRGGKGSPPISRVPRAPAARSLLPHLHRAL